MSVACEDSVDDENDIIVTNGSGCFLEVLSLDGIDRGSIEVAQTRRFDDVSDGVHELAAYRLESEFAPCDEHTTDFLDGDDDDFWVIECDCP
jgi:hypothetical protein